MRSLVGVIRVSVRYGTGGNNIVQYSNNKSEFRMVNSSTLYILCFVNPEKDFWQYTQYTDKSLFSILIGEMVHHRLATQSGLYS